MKYGSVCSGIEAASVAWHHLGWKAQWFSEIEHFPSEVLKYRFPAVENLGDMTKLTTNETFKASTIDLLVGGTPCQSFSVAGLRGGLADPRGNLMLTFLSLADSKKPRWIVWENVVGVLSSNGGKDFGTFLGALGELGYGFAYRVLDAQHFGVAQRRRRVFVVGYLGDWRVAAAVLFERESLQRDIKPSRKKREEVTADAEGSVRNPGTPRISNALCARDYKGSQPERDQGAPLIIDRAAFNQGENAQYEPRIEEGETMSSLVAKGPHAVAQPIPVTITFNDANGRRADRPNGGLYVTEEPKSTSALTCGGNDTKVMQPIAYSFDALSSNSMKSSNPHSGCREVDVAKTLDTTTPEPSKNQGGIAIAQPISIDHQCNASTNQFGTLIKGGEGGTQQFVAQPIPIHDQATRFNGKRGDKQDGKGNGLGVGQEYDPCPTLTKGDRHAVAQPIAFKVRGGCEGGGKGYLGQEEQAFTISATQDQQIAQPIAVDTYKPPMAIRRLTPKECERLQGFPDDWTQIPYRNKPADQCPDGPRYKACGNSMAVPVMRWIGERIQLIDTIVNG